MGVLSGRSTHTGLEDPSGRSYAAKTAYLSGCEALVAYVKFNTEVEMRKFLAGKRTRVDPAVLFHIVFDTEPLARPKPRVVTPDKLALSVADVAALTGFSRQTVTRLFQDEPGVLKIARPEKMHKRGYRSMRVPFPVYERVVRRLAVR